VTLLGDAAHLMSPFAGEGANLALLDGALLGQEIVEHPGETEQALTAYEDALFPRSAAKAQESVEGLELCFSENAVDRLVEMFSTAPADNA
jgi:2-polyprenyl-6-methoxyphenol hydroxylase-like FAD-dependent oxidoreductase